jgi:tetratricopeptide (TPR) repeat protein
MPLVLTVALAVGAWALAVWLPARNPTSYVLLVRAQRDFNIGNNFAVLDSAGKILARDPGFLVVYPLLADTYQRLGKKDEALKCYFEYALQSEKRGAYKDLAQAYIGIGWLYHLSGDYPQAREFYEKSVTVSKSNNDVYNEAVAMRKLAVWHMDKEQDDLALELLMRSAEINRDHQHTRAYRYNLARDYFNLGLVFTDKNDFAAAKNFYAKSQQIFASMGLTHELSDVYFNIVEIYFLEKVYQKALLFYAKGLKIDDDLGNVYNLAGDFNMFGELYCAIGKLDQAEEYYQKALKLARDIDAQPEQASIYFNMGRLYKLRKKYSQAREYFRSAQEIYRRIDTPTFDKVKEELLSLSH